MAVRTFKTEISKGYELVRIFEGTIRKAFSTSDLESLGEVFIPEKVLSTFTRCSVTGLHLSNIAQHKTLRSYAATAKRAIGVGYDGDMPHADNPMVIIQNLKNEWYAIRLKGYELEISPIKGDLDPYYDIGDGWEGQPFDKEKIWGWRWLTVNQSQSTNKRLLSIVDWFLKR